MTTFQKATIGAILAAFVVTGVYEVSHAVRLRNEVQRLRRIESARLQQIEQLSRERDEAVRRLATLPSRPAPRLPTPRLRAAPAATAPEALSSTNVVARLLQGGKALKLSSAQAESYLSENRRSSASLLAAFRSTGDESLLDEAMKKFPQDPQVAFEAAFKKDTTPEEQRRWLNALKESAPQNALADYLSAAHYFKNGQPDKAVEDVIAASGKSQFQDYTLDRVQDDEEAYRAAGYSVAEAKTVPSMQLLLPQLAQMKDLSDNLADLARSYREAGDESSAMAALQLAASLGQRYSNVTPGEPEISQLVGIAVERSALNAMDPNASYGSAGATVKDRLTQLAQQRAELEKVARQTEALQLQISDQDLISYKDRWRNFGEEAAGRWLVDKYSDKRISFAPGGAIR